MEPRTLMALLAASAMVLPVAAAESNATYRKEPDHAYPSWKMQILPGEAWIAANQSATFSIVLGSRVDTTVKLSIHKATEGATATLSSESIDVTPGGSSVVKLTVTPPSNATRSPYVVVVVGESADGEKHDARAAVYTKETKERPHEVKHKPVANDDARYRRLMERMEKLEERLQRLERLLCFIAGDRAPADLCPRAEPSTRSA